MNTCKLMISLLFLSISIFAQEASLFRIVENGKIGFIDNKGETVIEPIYLEAGEFSEGLASFRIGGQYGFINSSGEIAIPAKYDFAGDFQNGIVDVYVDGEVTFINKEGDRALPKRFESIRFIDKHFFIFTTKKEKSGLYDLSTSSVIMKAQKFKIGEFNDGLAVVTREGDNYPPDCAVINKKGKLIVDFGVYNRIQKFVDGYALVERHTLKNGVEDEDSMADGLIDTKGKLLFERPRKNRSSIDENFHDGLAVVNLYKYWLSEKDGVLWSSDKRYKGFINLRGDLVFSDTLAKYVNNFSNKRAFIEDGNRGYKVVDTDFNVLTKEPFDQVRGNGFVDGFAVVRTGQEWGIIDVNMNYVVQPEYNDIYEGGVINGMFFYKMQEGLYGLKDLKGNSIIEPMFSDFDVAGFKNGILKGIVENKLTYVNEAGKIVWQENIEDNVKTDNFINITHLSRANFYAYSDPKKIGKPYNGWSVSTNVPKRLSKKRSKNGLVLEEENHKLYIKNFSKKEIQFDAQDSRLYMKLQAKDKNGEWKNIEYLPSSWCGNSYHTIELSPKSYWEFDLPRYKGAFETSIRAELSYTDPVTNKSALTYSNEFKGSVNPGQFWRKPEYIARGIMDPYNE